MELDYCLVDVFRRDGSLFASFGDEIEVIPASDGTYHIVKKDVPGFAVVSAENIHNVSYRMNCRAGIPGVIDYLNGKYPGWMERVDLEILNMSSCSLCIVGMTKISESLLNSKLFFDVARTNPIRPYDWTICLSFSAYPVLTEEWKKAIEYCRNES